MRITVITTRNPTRLLLDESTIDYVCVYILVLLKHYSIFVKQCKSEKYIECVKNSVKTAFMQYTRALVNIYMSQLFSSQ